MQQTWETLFQNPLDISSSPPRPRVPVALESKSQYFLKKLVPILPVMIKWACSAPNAGPSLRSQHAVRALGARGPGGGDGGEERSYGEGRVGRHFLLQGIFPTWGSNPGLPHCRKILYRLSHQSYLFMFLLFAWSYSVGWNFGKVSWFFRSLLVLNVQ